MNEAPYLPDQPDQPDQPATGQDPAAGTGHPAVDAVLRAVAETAGEAPADQVPAYRAAHRTLRETLASIDEE